MLPFVKLIALVLTQACTDELELRINLWMKIAVSDKQGLENEK